MGFNFHYCIILKVEIIYKINNKNEMDLLNQMDLNKKKNIKEHIFLKIIYFIILDMLIIYIITLLDIYI